MSGERGEHEIETLWTDVLQRGVDGFLKHSEVTCNISNEKFVGVR